MDNKKLGCLTQVGFIGLAIAIAAIGITYVFSKNLMFSPGDLTARSTGRKINNFSSHIELTKDCQNCHPAPWDKTDMADLCLDCHQNVADQLEDSHSLHGAAVSVLSSNDCRVCHTDHLGQEAKITFFSGEDFPHNLVDFSLDSHQELKTSEDLVCSDCHPASFLEFDPILCTNCHLEINRSFTEIHSSIYSMDCLSCHDGLETINSAFDHSQASFELIGIHNQITCDACHTGSVNLDAFHDAPIRCFECHQEDDKHLGFLGNQCEECHLPTGWLPGIYDHTLTGFYLAGGHADLSCADCHSDLTFQGQSADCFSCHESDEPHQGEFGSDCTICHSVTTWDDIHFDHSGPFAENCSYCHQNDSPTDHYQGQCSACHIITGWLPATFNHAAAGATDCQSCHFQDRPDGHFVEQCSLCHSTARWKPSTINHTFPTSHEGANNRCVLCHPGNNFYTYSCYECHEHNRSEVVKEHEGISNIDNCIRCHWDGRKHESGDDD